MDRDPRPGVLGQTDSGRVILLPPFPEVMEVDPRVLVFEDLRLGQVIVFAAPNGDPVSYRGTGTKDGLLLFERVPPELLP